MENACLTFNAIYYSQYHNNNIFHYAVHSPTCRLAVDKFLNIPFITVQPFNTLTEQKIKTNKTIPAATLNSC